MSKENVKKFFAAERAAGAPAPALADDPSAQDVVDYALTRGFEFSKEDLRGVLKELIYGAQSLPAGWGWALARNLNLVRKV